AYFTLLFGLCFVVLCMVLRLLIYFSIFFFFFNDTATTEIYTLSLHDGSSDLPTASASGTSASLTSTYSNPGTSRAQRSEEHTSELQSRQYLVCRLLLEKKK